MFRCQTGIKLGDDALKSSCPEGSDLEAAHIANVVSIKHWVSHRERPATTVVERQAKDGDLSRWSRERMCFSSTCCRRRSSSFQLPAKTYMFMPRTVVRYLDMPRFIASPVRRATRTWETPTSTNSRNTVFPQYHSLRMTQQPTVHGDVNRALLRPRP